MRIKEDLMLRDICGTWMVVPMGERLMEFPGMIKLNDTGTFIWRRLEEGLAESDIVEAMLNEYEVTKEQAEEQLRKFEGMLIEEGLAE